MAEKRRNELLNIAEAIAAFLVAALLRVAVGRLLPGVEQHPFYLTVYPVLVFVASAVCGELIYRTKGVFLRLRTPEK